MHAYAVEADGERLRIILAFSGLLTLIALTR